LIITEELVKVYRRGNVRALDNFTVEVKGEGITCLLGRNGAGKTTFLRIVGTQLMPTSGRFTVLGYDGVSEADEIRKRIAVVPQESRPFLLWTPWEFVYHYALLRGASRATANEETRRVLDELGLHEYRNRVCFDLSGGLRRRVIVAAALVSSADLLLLDEPTIGLDPVARRSVWRYLRRISSMGHKILLTTHYLDEAEALSDDVIIIDQGRLVAHDRSESLKRKLGFRFTVVIGQGVEKESRLVHVGDEKELLEVVDRAIREVGRVEIRPVSLEDVFLRLVGAIEE